MKRRFGARDRACSPRMEGSTASWRAWCEASNYPRLKLVRKTKGMSITVPQINDLMQQALSELEARKPEWDLTAEKQSLDTTNHVLRVLAQENAAEAAREACYRLLDAQHEDGGWGEFSNDEKS